MKLFPFLMISALFVLVACDPRADNQFLDRELSDSQDIIGGAELGKNDARRYYVAKLEIKRPGAADGVCTATQITNTLLLTAAHCFFDDKGRPAKTSGSRVFYSSDTWRGQTRSIKSVHIHPEYSKDKLADLAIVKIYGLAPDTQTLLPLSFEKPSEEMFNLTSIGYGITNLRKFSDNDGQGLGTLRVVQTFSIGYLDQDRSVVIDQRSGKGLNGGDSGGPAIYMDNGQPTVIGVARNVTPRKDGRAIVFDRQGTYTSTHAFKEWLMKTISEQSDF